jgi:hypothetical protein
VVICAQQFFRPSGAGVFLTLLDPRLAPWASFFRRFAAGRELDLIRDVGFSRYVIRDVGFSPDVTRVVLSAHEIPISPVPTSSFDRRQRMLRDAK